jgi:hypothetical protein
MTEPDAEGERIQSLDSLSDRIGGIEAKLDQLLGGAHDRAEKHEEKRLGRPSTVEEQVQAELARARREADEKAAAEQDKQERQSLASRLAALEERPPVQPQPRRQRVMWGKK